MRQRQRSLDLNGKFYFLAANRALVLTRKIGVDLHARPLFLGGCRVYDERGDVVCLGGRDDALLGDDLVVDILHDDQAAVPTEVLIQVAAHLAEDHVQQAIVDLEVGEEMTHGHVEDAIDSFLLVEPRFARFRTFLIKAGVRYAIDEELR